MKKTEWENRVGSLAALLLFGIFAACVLFVLLSGADIYKKITERGKNTGDCRTALQYLTTKIHQADAENAFGVYETEGIQALVILDNVGEQPCRTWLYVWDGYLCELFGIGETVFEPENGIQVLEAEELEFVLQDHCIELCIQIQGQKRQQTVFLRSGKELHNE